MYTTGRVMKGDGNCEVIGFRGERDFDGITPLLAVLFALVDLLVSSQI